MLSEISKNKRFCFLALAFLSAAILFLALSENSRFGFDEPASFVDQENNSTPIEHSKISPFPSQPDIPFPENDQYNSKLYRQFRRYAFSKALQIQNHHGAVLEAFEDNRLFYECLYPTEGGCQNRTMTSSKRIMVIMGAHMSPGTLKLNKIGRNHLLTWPSRNIICRYASNHSQSPPHESESWSLDIGDDRKFVLVMVACPLNSTQTTPDSVTLSFQKPVLGLIHKDIPITKAPTPQKSRHNRLEACIAPMHGDVSENLIEWIEYHRMMGVKHFHFYDYDSEIDTKQIIQFYARKYPQEFTIYNWEAFSRKDKYHYFGQHLFMQHCLYNNMGHSDYLMFFDVDEFLLPIRGETIPELLDYLELKYDAGYNGEIPPDTLLSDSIIKTFVPAYRLANWFFRNVCSPRNQTADEIHKQHKVDLVTQRVFWKTVSPIRWNGKFLVKTRNVVWMKVAKLGMDTNYRNDSSVININHHHEGHFHHYRSTDKELKGPCLARTDYIKDWTLMHLRDPLYARVAAQSSEIWSR